MDSDPATRVESFLKIWQGQEGGQERANYALFLTGLCDVLGVEKPKPAGATTELNDYVFERAVKFKSADGATSNGRIDLYKRGCFVLEAKIRKSPDSKACLATMNRSSAAGATPAGPGTC